VRLAPESVGYGGGDREPAPGRNKAAYGGLRFGLGPKAQIRSGVVAADPQSPLRIAPFRCRRNNVWCCPHSKVRHRCPLRTRLEPRVRTLPRERDQTVISVRSLDTLVPIAQPWRQIWDRNFRWDANAGTQTLYRLAAHPALTSSPSVKRRYLSVAFDCRRPPFAGSRYALRPSPRLLGSLSAL
jgi:hypothetical protein